MSISPQASFGVYRVVGELGNGGMGRVLLVTHPNEQQYALKHIHPNLLQQSNYYQRFQREMDLMQRLRHPNLMPLLDRGFSGNLPYYIMPYIDGLSVKDYIRSYGALNIEQAYMVVNAVCNALVYVHAQGIYHRDIKPHNIMLDQHWNPFLTDFGIAADMRANTDLTSTMQRAGMGTQSYTAPEIYAGVAASARSDLYSLGITVYEMFTGEHLFKAYTRDTEDPYAALPDELRPVILRAIDHNPKARFQTVTDFQQAYQQASQRSLRPKQMPAPVAPITNPAAVSGSQVPGSAAHPGYTVAAAPNGFSPLLAILLTMMAFTIVILFVIVLRLVTEEGAVAVAVTQTVAPVTEEAQPIGSADAASIPAAADTTEEVAVTEAVTEADAPNTGDDTGGGADAVSGGSPAPTSTLLPTAAPNADAPAAGTKLFVQQDTNVYPNPGGSPSQSLAAGDEVTVGTGIGAGGAPATYYDLGGDRYLYIQEGQGWVRQSALGETPPPTQQVLTNMFVAGGMAVTNRPGATEFFILDAAAGGFVRSVPPNTPLTIRGAAVQDETAAQWWWPVIYSAEDGSVVPGWIEDNSLAPAP